jgi:uncharacterized protein involved in exopolysaccharide biosynthesis
MSESSTALHPFSGDDLRQINQLQLITAQCSQISGRLSNLAELKAQLETLGKDPNREINLMRNRHAELAKQLRSQVNPAPIGA